MSLRSLRSLVAVLLCTGVLLSLPGAYGQDTEAPAYQVDLVLFRHAEPFTAGEVFELSRVSPLIPTFSDVMPEGEPDEDPEAAAQEPEAPRRLIDHPEVPENELLLRETAQGINNATRFELVGHVAWRQDALPTDEAPAQRIALGGIRGQVLLSRSRFLRLDIDLGFSVDGQPVRLAQTRRRVQLGKPHYIDHPYIGAIIQVSRPPKGEAP